MEGVKKSIPLLSAVAIIVVVVVAEREGDSERERERRNQALSQNRYGAVARCCNDDNDDESDATDGRIW